ncbi:hypothetical protein C923_02348 [Plasmodium falciparum UGT5.1]|uniref:Uncharacterized protein n=2 Tax=Plasmodium falciparum TaxID=5833 RepID=W7JQ20_PLAFA|nr:hypothetical protein C923_02348 [Plasmodium falciparum UGT5.1]
METENVPLENEENQNENYALCQAVSALIRNSNTPQAFLIPELNNNEKNEFNNNEKNEMNNNLNNEFNNNEEICDIQKIAEEMMENLLNENDMYTNIMLSLQNRLSDDYLCSEPKYENICIHEKDKISLSFPCSNPKYEKLIHKFTFKKLCNSKAAFNNTLLKSFIEEDEEQNTFSLMLKQFKILLTCVDDELKDIYKESIDLLVDLKTSITELTQKLWSGKMVNVLKKREFLIAGILCELRNGNKSPLISKSLEFENLGILKINNEELLNEAYNAFSDYYYFFPYFIQKLLEKGGMIERLIKIHENLTKYRTKDMVNKINAQSKGEVLNNEDILNKLNAYKHYTKHGATSFIQSREVKIVNQNVNNDDTTKNQQQNVNNNEKLNNNNNNNNNNQQVNNNNNNNNNNQQVNNNNNNNNNQLDACELEAHQLLNCKKYIYFSIDANRDTSSAKNLKDIELFNKWKKGMILLSNENGIVLPQILIDGVPLGNDVTLQNLEDEGILDYIIARLKCPNCLIDKSNIEERCPGCKKYYVTLITDDLIQNDSVIRILQGEPYKEPENE